MVWEHSIFCIAVRSMVFRPCFWMSRTWRNDEREKGMFSFLGVNVGQVQTLVNDYSIYLVNSSRINVAGINDANIEYLSNSLAAVLKA